jgi:hypothetical protein
MPTVTLSAKAHDNSQLKLVSDFLESKIKGLNVKTEVCGLSPRRWIQIAVSGEDEKAAMRYLAREIGLGPTRLEDVEKFQTMKGYMVTVDNATGELRVDVGIFLPKIVDFVIPLQCLQAQLADGRKVAFKKLAELFGFCENLPLTVKIINIDKEKKYVEAMLANEQLNQYGNWTKSMLDRLIIIGSSIHAVRSTLKRMGLNRDILSVESLGLFEFALTCKLGTDAAGLIPKIGNNLRRATLTVFNPKKVLQFLDYSTALTSQ